MPEASAIHTDHSPASCYAPVHAEDGQWEAAVEFDFDAIRINGFDPPAPENDPTEFTVEELDAASKAFTQMVSWIWQDGKNNSEGITIRAIIVCWIFLSHLRPLTLTEMARGFGKKKQSLGRWVDDFKSKFPDIRICHMKE